MQALFSAKTIYFLTGDSTERPDVTKYKVKSSFNVSLADAKF